MTKTNEATKTHTYELNDGQAGWEVEAASSSAALADAVADSQSNYEGHSESTVYFDLRCVRSGECYGTRDEDDVCEGCEACEQIEQEVRVDPIEPGCHGFGKAHKWHEGEAHGSAGGIKWTNDCRRCGLLKHTDTWGHRRDNGAEGYEIVRYEEKSA